jgi:hypothetical protein
MPDLVLKDGREIEIDLHKITIGEWRALLDPKQPDDEEYKTIAKVSGLTAEEVEELSFLDFRSLGQAISQKAANPISDPN